MLIYSNRCWQMQKRASTTRDILYYFLYNSWIFSTERSSSLTQSLSEADKREFPFEPTSYTWAEYMPRHCRGIQDLLMKNIKQKIKKLANARCKNSGPKQLYFDCRTISEASTILKQKWEWDSFYISIELDEGMLYNNTKLNVKYAFYLSLSHTT